MAYRDELLLDVVDSLPTGRPAGVVVQYQGYAYESLGGDEWIPVGRYGREFALVFALGGGFWMKQASTADAGVALNTGSNITTLGLAIPVGAIPVAARVKVVTGISGVSSSACTVAAAFTGGSSAAIGNLVSSGNGNLTSGTRIKKMYDWAIAGAVAGSTADIQITITGVDSLPSAGSVKADVMYIELDEMG